MNALAVTYLELGKYAQAESLQARLWNCSDASSVPSIPTP